jgi:hypothetical protein
MPSARARAESALANVAEPCCPHALELTRQVDASRPGQCARFGKKPISQHQTERLTRDPIGESRAPVFKDCASVVKNSLSLSVTLAAVSVEGALAGVVAGAVVVVGGCKKFNTLVNAVKSRVRERLGIAGAGCVLGAEVLVVPVVPLVPVVLVGTAAV